jgi:hypothetical protein
VTGRDKALLLETTEYDLYMLKMQKKYCMRYFGNIYLLNRAALRIQHWFFSKKQAKLKVSAPKTYAKERTPPKEITYPKDRNKTRRERNAEHFKRKCARNIHFRCPNCPKSDSKE